MIVGLEIYNSIACFSNSQDSLYHGWQMCFLIYICYALTNDSYKWQLHTAIRNNSHPSICKHIFAWSSIRKHISSACNICSFVGEPVLLHVLPSFIPFVTAPCLFVNLYLQSLMTRWHQIHKPPSLPWCIIVGFWMQMTGRKDKAMKLRKEGFQLGCELWALLVKIA